MSGQPAAMTSKRRVRTPTVLQVEAVECGAACLAMVLASHGRWVPLEKLREDCGISRDGSKASNIVKAARRYGLEANGYQLEPQDLQTRPLPMILFWNFQHFVVLEGMSRGRYYLNDPAAGPRTVDAAEFDRAFTGVALTFTPGPAFQKGGDRGRFLQALKRRFRGSVRPLLYVMLAGLLLAVPGLVLPSFSRIFVDDILVGEMRDWQRPFLLAMLSTVSLYGALTWLQRHCLLRHETKLALTSSARFFEHLFRLPISFFLQRYAGDLARRVQLNDRVAQFLSGEVASNALALLLIAFYGVLMVQYDPVLAAVGVLAAVLSLAVLKTVSRRSSDLNQKMLLDLGKLYGSTMHGIQMFETLKATGSESDYFAQWSGYHTRMVNGRQGLERITLSLGVVPPLLMSLATVAVLVLGALRVMDGHLTMGMLVAFQALLLGFLMPVNELVGLGERLQALKGNLTRLDDVLAYPEAPSAARAAGDDGRAHQPSASVPARLSGALELRDVTFGYSPLEPPLIEGFNLRMQPGDRVALVGGSGSGKSTIAKLVTGLYEPWSGEVLVDGERRGDIARRVLSNSMALVDQDVFLFEGTVRGNLGLWDLSLPEERLIEAAKDAQIHDVVAARKGGYGGAVVEGGGNFSGGERQRLEIARALARRPSVLVLDEATSALDAAAEKRVDDRIRAAGCTCLIIAHRLSTIRDCDEIVVLDRGKVVERGSHTELMRNGKVYPELVRTA